MSAVTKFLLAKLCTPYAALLEGSILFDHLGNQLRDFGVQHAIVGSHGIVNLASYHKNQIN